MARDNKHSKIPSDDDMTKGKGDVVVEMSVASETELRSADADPWDAAGAVNADAGELRQPTSVLADGWGPYLKRSFRVVLLGHWMNLLLLATPFAIISNYAEWPPVRLCALRPTRSSGR